MYYILGLTRGYTSTAESKRCKLHRSMSLRTVISRVTSSASAFEVLRPVLSKSRFFECSRSLCLRSMLEVSSPAPKFLRRQAAMSIFLSRYIYL